MNADRFYSGFIQTGFWGNTFYSYACAVILFLIILSFLYFLKNMALGRLKAPAGKTETGLDDLAVELLSEFRWFEYQLLAFYLSVRHLEKNFWFRERRHRIRLSRLNVFCK